MTDNNFRTITVELDDRSYPISIGSGWLAKIKDSIGDLPGAEHAVVICDQAVESLYADSIADQLRTHMRVDQIAVPPGESAKSIDQLNSIWNRMLECGTDRQSLVVAVGGGVIGDLAGFAAASFARGIRFVQVPTTLLAQVDSSVGGKTGINLAHAKNMVGAFWQPTAVWIDTDVLNTLGTRDFRSGLAEVVKYGVILDDEFFSFLEQNADSILALEPAALANIVARSCQLKADVVAEDERETSGRRAILNYGHTFGHAYETLGNYSELLHGEAVSIGMACAARLSSLMGWTDEAFTTRQDTLLQRFGLPTCAPDQDLNRVIELMRHDKKATAGKLNFVLAKSLGHVEVARNVPSDQVMEALQAVPRAE